MLWCCHRVTIHDVNFLHMHTMGFIEQMMAISKSAGGCGSACVLSANVKFGGDRILPFAFVLAATRYLWQQPALD